MKNELILNAEHRRQLLARLKKDLAENKPIISLSGLFKLTKTENHYSRVYLHRDLDLENSVKTHLNKTLTYSKIISRYNDYDKEMTWTDWPPHYAVRILSGTGPISCGKNIFAFFPEALRLLPKDPSDVFGLEFIDVWENVFQKIVFPCVKKVFNLSTQLEIYQKLEMNLSRTIYLAAVFHEMGHRCGPWKVSPQARPGIKLSAHHWGVMGEIATDSLLVTRLEEFPEIALFVTLQRLFWFGRRGTSENPISGLTNTDNDAWLGSMLWNKLIELGALAHIKNSGRWNLKTELLPQTFRHITKEIDSLACSLVLGSLNQDHIIFDWMKTKVEWTANFGFIIPDQLSELYELCSDLDDQAHFKSPFSLKDFQKLNPSEITHSYQGA